MPTRFRNGTRAAPCVLTLTLVAVASAASFDGSAPLDCAVSRGHDCLPENEQCRPLKPETHVAPVFRIDFAKHEVKSPYRTAKLRIAQLTTNTESLVLHGADLLFAWSALINKTTGAFTVSVADRSGAYVAFGQCKVAKADSRRVSPAPGEGQLG